ncbi:hypothetical protein KSF_107580 [Reticulibacter mediterranei]|uniref:Uncharacterized protein n=1 Tax=Reticulibacter mediterranei TaxID=2778369 RepID=A0A8J3J1R0_9CHLR|nr:hypothetical protein [Reticulibacter mediterranei]GHP00711.1 hypothetical protein KSF_107580 [Reticulibacter mediterranei]
MKLVNARTGKLQVIPFALGKKGRARTLVPVDVDKRNPPAGPDSIGYAVVPGGGVLLTQLKPEQGGILVHINTEGTYTRGTSGYTKLKGGKATKIAEGSYAYGDAGGLGGGSDELWHVESLTALWVVYLSGGSYKGYGLHYCVLTRSGTTHLLKRDELCQLIATDEKPDIVEVVYQYKEVLHQDIQNAFQVAERLEDFSASEKRVQHFFTGDLAFSLEETFQIAVPEALKPLQCGVSGIEAGTLMPGEKALFLLHAGPGGGRRYSWKIEEPRGLQILKEVDGWKGTSSDILALVEQPDWYYAWSEYKDRELYAYCFVNANGIYKYGITGECWNSYSWEGREYTAPSWEEVAAVFGLQSVVDEKEQMSETNTAQEEEVSLETLQSRINSRRLQ